VLDIERLREDPKGIEENLARRRHPPYLHLLEEVRAKDVAWRAAVREADGHRARRNALGKQVAAARKGGQPAETLIAESEAIAGALEEAETKEGVLRRERDDLLRRLPNLLDPSVPYGVDDRENVVVATWGTAGKAAAGAKPHG